MKILKRFYHLIVDNNLSILAGALCFFILINGGSLLFLFISFSSYIPLDVKNIVLNSIDTKNLTFLVNYFFEYNSNIPVSFILIITSIYSSSTLFKHYILITNTLCKRNVKRRIRNRIIAIILVPISLIIYFFLVAFLAIINNFIGKTIYYILTTILIFISIYILNIIALRSFKLNKIYKGLLISYIYVVLFTAGFFLFINISKSFKLVYGVFSFYIILLFYAYISILGILLGITVNCQKLEEFNIYII